MNSYIGQITKTGDYVTIEDFAADNFKKYVNNNGLLSTANDEELQRKAECLVHFSYLKSKKKLMLVDIQGSDYSLTDPEVATLDGSFDDDQLLFCAGNLSDVAYSNFFHVCNVFCRLLNLEPQIVSENKNSQEH